eukprot:TRINITY_DN50623_c0_g1_i3.p1 TRINITY_DN50623_c0_g1~~TRINITY_DN50623_c0_g1_i3.p1  ORF type:complete len:367 (+),score=78.47 TRINITY_DN50623_c0_g1_i3:88-1188(+)
MDRPKHGHSTHVHLDQCFDQDEDPLRPCPLQSMASQLPPEEVDPEIMQRSEDLMLNCYAAVRMIMRVQSRETVLVIVLTAISLAIVDYLDISVDLSWTFVTIVIVFPLTGTIQMAFKRREEANRILADVVSLIHCISLAHRDWAVNTPLPESHSADVNEVLKNLTYDLQKILQCPRMYARDAHCISSAKAEVLSKMIDTRLAFVARFLCGIRTLSTFTEVKKAAGMPANEASRINQYTFFLQARFHTLRNIKKYRTPQVLRSMSRFFIVVTPVVFAPYFKHIKEQAGGWPFASVFALFITFALVSLLHVVTSLEDPFDGDGTDDIQVVQTLSEARAMLDLDEKAVLSTMAEEMNLEDWRHLDRWSC